MTILLKLICKVTSIPLKISVGFCLFVCFVLFFLEMDRLILKFIGKCKRSRTGKTILKTKENVKGRTLPDFKIHYKATVIKTIWLWHKNRLRNQRNRTEYSEINLYIHNQLFFLKTVQRGKYHFSTNGTRTTEYPYVKGESGHLSQITYKN